MPHLPSRNLFWLAIVLVTGCAPGTTTTRIDGVSVSVLNARYDGPVANATNVEKGDIEPKVPIKHRWTISAGGASQSYIVEIIDSRLSINGVSYGTVAKDDIVVIDGGKVTMNGKVRSPE